MKTPLEVWLETIKQIVDSDPLGLGVTNSKDAIAVIEKWKEALEFYSNNGSHVILTKDKLPENGRFAKEALDIDPEKL